MSGTLFGSPSSGAVLSGDRRYRYVLTRRWDQDGPTATFVMLNPSTADAHTDDPTIRRCVGFARSWGMAALAVVNLYGLRATDPKALRTDPDPVGPDNDAWLAWYARTAQQRSMPLVAAWGVHAQPARVAAVLEIDGMGGLTALGTTKDGHPRHPLYLPGTAQREPWPS